ncbi:MAG: hypothetical protein ACXVZV_10690 [Terriglobales bacterium]
MTEALRPMSTGELLDRTFSLYKRHFLLFVGIAVPAPAIYLVVQLTTAGITQFGATSGVSSSRFNTTAIVGLVVTVLVAVLGWMLGLALTHAATILAVSAVHLGRPTSVRESYAGLKGRYGRIVNVFLSVAVRVFGGSILLYMAAVMVAALAVGAAATLGTIATVVGVIVALAAVIAAIILAISLFVRYSLAIQACVVEDIPAKQSLKRSIFLAKGSRNRILTVYILFAVINFAIVLTLAFGLGALAAATKSVQVITATNALSTFMAGVLTGPLATVAMSLVYYDERVRKEAFDLQLMMAALDGPQASAAASATS